MINMSPESPFITGYGTKFTSIQTPARVLFVESDGNKLNGYIESANILSDTIIKMNWALRPNIYTNIMMILSEPGSFAPTKYSYNVYGYNTKFLTSYKPGSTVTIDISNGYYVTTTINYIIDDANLIITDIWPHASGSFSAHFNYNNIVPTCDGYTTEVQNCNAHSCPIDGGWSEWSDNGLCDKECGGGMLIQSRTCTEPTPAFGGSGCIGDPTQSIPCNEYPCPPINGGWTEWVDDGPCDKECGGGMLIQSRTCTEPTPAFGGSGCIGDSIQSSTCNIQECPINGGWSDWVNSGDCDKECGDGSIMQTRSCTNPSPQNGGSGCIGDTSQYILCNLGDCVTPQLVGQTTPQVTPQPATQAILQTEVISDLPDNSTINVRPSTNNMLIEEPTLNIVTATESNNIPLDTSITTDAPKPPLLSNQFIIILLLVLTVVISIVLFKIGVVSNVVSMISSR
jgi:hypothetical protein